MQRGVRQTV